MPGRHPAYTFANLSAIRLEWHGRLVGLQILDEAACAARGWSAGMTDGQILDQLLALNKERTVGEGALVTGARASRPQYSVHRRVS